MIRKCLSLMALIVFLTGCNQNTPQENAPVQAIEPETLPVKSESKSPTEFEPEIPEPRPMSEGDDPKNYGRFKPLELTPLTTERFQGSFHAVPDLLYIDAQFIPLGWSKDGRYFAYAIEPADEACGCYMAEIILQDLVSDEKVWEEKWTASHRDFVHLWTDQQSLIQGEFEKYQIDNTETGTFLPGKFIEDVSFKVSKEYGVNPDYSDVPGVLKYSIHAINELGATKQLHRDEMEYPFIYDIDVIGLIRGPDEDRVALVIAQLWRGWEGPPHVTRFEIVGAHLRTGFKD